MGIVIQRQQTTINSVFGSRRTKVKYLCKFANTHVYSSVCAYVNEYQYELKCDYLEGINLCAQR